MTQTPDLLESHLQCLRASLNTLSNEAMDLAVDHELSLQLSELCSRLSDSTSECISHSPLGPGAALDIIGQARASLDLLSSAGCSLGEKDGREGDGLAPRLRSALGELVMAAGKELRREASARVFGLYVIIDPEFTAGRDPLEVAHGALKGGARMLQLRDKIREKGQTLPLARQLSQICAEYGALFILNDHADLASVVGSGRPSCRPGRPSDIGCPADIEAPTDNRPFQSSSGGGPGVPGPGRRSCGHRVHLPHYDQGEYQPPPTRRSRRCGQGQGGGGPAIGGNRWDK